MAPTSIRLLLWTFVAGVLAQYGNSNSASSSPSSAMPATTTSSGSSPVHTVQVGAGGKLAFSPNSFTAGMGDQVQFQFSASSPPHSVAQGSFDNPCQPSNASAFYSGFVSDTSKPFTITINSTDPIFFYCSQVGHCQAGMVGVINPASGQGQSDYASAASNTGRSTSPAQVQGGVFAAAVVQPSSASSAAPSSTSTMDGSAIASTPMVVLGAAAGLFAAVVGNF